MRPATWLHELAHELAARGVSADQAAGIVVEAEGHLNETAAPPLDAFGSPSAYAALVADALEPPAAAPTRGRVRLSAHGLTKRYGSTRVLDGLDLELHDGEAVLLMG